MSQNLVVNFIGDNKLSKTTTVISNDLKKMGAVGDKVGRGLNKALGALGLALGMQQLTKALKDSAHAAVEDSRSKDLLALSLRNTIGATKSTTDAANDWITKTQLATSVLDDKLRPALAQTVASTGSLAKGQELLNLALNVSAYSQKDLGVVTKALTKAQNGQFTGLNKLGLGTKFTADWFNELTKQTKGAATAAANSDPFQRIQIIFAELQETIGYQLLPYLQQFADQLASPQGQIELKKLVDGFVGIAKAAGEIIKFMSKNIGIIVALVKFAIELKIAWMLNVGAMKLFTWWTNRSAQSMAQLGLAVKRTGLGLLIVGLAELAVGFQQSEEAGTSFVDWAYNTINTGGQGVVDFMQWVFGNKTKAQKDKAKADAFSNRWIALGKHFENKTTNGLKKSLKSAASKLNKSGVEFRDSVGLAFGTFGKDENSFFDVNTVIEKLKRVVDAAKGFKENLAKLTKAGAGADVKAELIAMGPAQGNIVAKGLLQSGKLSEYLGLRGSLYKTGVGVDGVKASDATYNININKAVVSADDIIKAIRDKEKKTGRKYFAN
ncbi:MAG: hypothetical protein WCK24_01075 [Actinomycetes bacterium]